MVNKHVYDPQNSQTGNKNSNVLRLLPLLEGEAKHL